MKKFHLIFYTLFTVNLYAQQSYLEEMLDSTNEYRKYIHHQLVSSAHSIDNYYFEEENHELDDYKNTYALVQLSAFYSDDDKLTFKPKVKLKLKLPRLKDRLNLVFESDEQRDSTDYVEDHTQNEDNDYNLSLLYNKYLKNSFKFKAKVGIKLHSKVDPFVKVELKKHWRDIKSFDFILSNSLKQSVEKKLEYTSYFEIVRPINHYFTVHNYNEYYWNSPNKADSEIYNTVYLNQKLDDKNLLTYKIDSNIDNIDTNLKLKRYSAKIKYRHYFKNWLYTDVVQKTTIKMIVDLNQNLLLSLILVYFLIKISY